MNSGKYLYKVTGEKKPQITKKVNGAEIVLSGVLRAYQLQDEAINYSLR